MKEFLVTLFSENFGISTASSTNVSIHILDATLSRLPSPQLGGTRPTPEALLKPRETELVDALESPLIKEVSLEQAEEWSAILRSIATGKKRISDQVGGSSNFPITIS